MLSGGDEYGRSQRGNNNAYCQDNEISWLSWQRTPQEDAQTEFTARLIAFRREHPIFRRPKFFQGREVRGAGVKDIMWLNPGGQEMSDAEWGRHFVKTLGVLFCGDALDVRDWHGTPITDDTFLMLLNASHEPVDFMLPKNAGQRWSVVLDTKDERGFPDPQPEHASGERLTLTERSLMLLCRRAK